MQKVPKVFSDLKQSDVKAPAKVFYAGCFDPFTIGHLDVVKQALERFDQVIIGLGVSEKKSRFFDRTKMIAAIEDVLRNENIQDKVLCLPYDNYTGDTALKHGCACIVRGIKSKEEFEYELWLANYNRHHYKINTLFFLPSRQELEKVSSTYAKELYKTDNDKLLKEILPAPVFDYIWNKVKKFGN